MLVRIIILYLIVVFLLVFFVPGMAYVFAQANPAHPPVGSPAHQYPMACCGLNDCNPIPDDAVTETHAGVIINGTGEFLAYDDPRIMVTPPEFHEPGWHWCRHIKDGVDGKTICLYRPDRGV